MHQQTQSQQYALTIVALEEKLLALMDKCQQLVDENEAFKQSLQNTDINENDKGIAYRCRKRRRWELGACASKFSVGVTPTLYVLC